MIVLLTNRMLEVVEACVGLLTAVNRCHFPLVAATPGPFLVATNNILSTGHAQ